MDEAELFMNITTVLFAQAARETARGLFRVRGITLCLFPAPKAIELARSLTYSRIAKQFLEPN